MTHAAARARSASSAGSTLRGVLGVHAEAERHAELRRSGTGDGGGLMGEVAVHGVDAHAAEDPHDLGGLLFGGALAEMVDDGDRAAPSPGAAR